MKEAIFHSLRSRLQVVQAQRLVVIQCACRCSYARRTCAKKRWAIRSIQSRFRSQIAHAYTYRHMVTSFLSDAVVACDEDLIGRYLVLAQPDQVSLIVFVIVFLTHPSLGRCS